LKKPPRKARKNPVRLEKKPSKKPRTEEELSLHDGKR